MGGACVRPDPQKRLPTPIPSSRPIAATSKFSFRRQPSDDDIWKASDFEGFLIDFEGDSDEVEVSPTEQNYPRPSPTGRYQRTFDDFGLFSDFLPKPENVQAQIAITDIVAHGRNAPKAVLSSYEFLIRYLEQPISEKSTRDEVLVRGILAWLSNQDVETYVTGDARVDTPLGYLSLLGQRRSTYSTFFTVICRRANIKCVQIHGICKAGKYQAGDRKVKELSCAWNAVYINDSWQLVHPYWVCRSVFGKKPGGWIKLEKSGQAIGKREIEAAGTVRNVFKEYYIMPDPAKFIYRCHPNDRKWQLLSDPITRDKFLDQSYSFLPMWGLGIKLVTSDLCTLESKGSPVVISFEVPIENAQEIVLDYEFFIRKKENYPGNPYAEDMLSDMNIPRLVSKIRHGSRIDFYIQCPVEGIYRIVIFGAPEKQHFLRLCEFKIKCLIRTQNCALSPLDPGLLGFGPSRKSERAGLIIPSHTNGLITTGKGRRAKLSFLLDSGDLERCELDAKLIGQDVENGSASLKWTINQDAELKIVIDIVNDGDYGLQILTRKVERNRPVVPMDVVCNYLVSSTFKFVYEKANKRNARRRLLAAIESADQAEINMVNVAMETLQSCIERCLKEHVSSTDSDILNAQKKINILAIRKDIHEAFMRRHLEVTRKAIETIEASVFYRIFVRSVDRLRDLEAELEESWERQKKWREHLKTLKKQHEEED